MKHLADTPEMRRMVALMPQGGLQMPQLMMSAAQEQKKRRFTLFLSGCCMAQRRSLSGRSPFCQRKLSDSRKFNGNLFLESNNINHKQKTQNTPTTMQSPRECRDG